MAQLIFNQPWSQEKRRALRNNMTKAEKKFWYQVKGGRFQGLKFRRQESIGPYIADFYCPELHLVIEVDGVSHLTADQKRLDKIRDEYMIALKLRVFRCTNEDVVEGMEPLLQRLTAFVRPLLASPSKGEGFADL